MSRPAASHTSHPSFPASSAPERLALAIDRFVIATFAHFEAVVLEVVPTFTEPRADDPRRALRNVRRAAELLSGFAVGATIAALARTLRRGFGGATEIAIAAELARIGRGGGPRGALPMHVTPAPFLPAGDRRPQVDELGAQLLVRLRRSVPETRRHIAALAAACTEAQHAMVMTLDLLAADDAPALAFAVRLQDAWTTLGAEPAPPPAPVLSQTELVAEGFLVRIH